MFLYILGAAVLFALFQFIYTRITPHKEFELIRSGNVAAAIALGGAMIGFAIPASNVIAYSISILDFVVWAVIAAFVQLLAFLVTSLVLKGASERIKKRRNRCGYLYRGSGHQRRHVERRLHDSLPELIAPRRSR